MLGIHEKMSDCPTGPTNFDNTDFVINFIIIFIPLDKETPVFINSFHGFVLSVKSWYFSGYVMRCKLLMIILPTKTSYFKVIGENSVKSWWNPGEILVKSANYLN